MLVPSFVRRAVPLPSVSAKAQNKKKREKSTSVIMPSSHRIWVESSSQEIFPVRKVSHDWSVYPNALEGLQAIRVPQRTQVSARDLR